MTDPAKQPIDWAAIELDYRAGLKSLRAIGEEYGVPHATIYKRAKTLEWKRDLTAKVKAREDELVNKALVDSTVDRETLVHRKKAEDRKVEEMAFTKATVRIDHAGKIRRTMALFMSMLGDLEVTSNPEGQGLIESLMDAVKEPEGEETADERKSRRKKQADLLEKVVALPGRIDSGKRLTDMLDRLVAMERQAYGITDKEGFDPDGSGRVLSDTERASRAAAMLAEAFARKAAAALSKPAEPAHAA